MQLAARAGAHVIAAVGSAARGEGLAKLGAAEVVVGVAGVTEPVFGVLDNVGGPLLAEAFSLARRRGLSAVHRDGLGPAHHHRLRGRAAVRGA